MQKRGPNSKNPPQFTIVPDAVAARQTPTTARAATAIKAPRPNTALHLQNSAITRSITAGCLGVARRAKHKEQPVARIAQEDGPPHQKQSAA